VLLGQETYSGLYPVIVTFNANYDMELLESRETTFTYKLWLN